MVEKGEDIPNMHITIFNHMKRFFGGGGWKPFMPEPREGTLSIFACIVQWKNISERKGGRNGMVSAIQNSITMGWNHHIVPYCHKKESRGGVEDPY